MLKDRSSYKSSQKGSTEGVGGREGGEIPEESYQFKIIIKV